MRSGDEHEGYGARSIENFIKSLNQDLRYAFRMMKKKPALAGIVVLTLAFGIGVNAALFSVIDWLRFRPLPVPGVEQLATLLAQRTSGEYSNTFSYPDFEDIRNESTTLFSQMAAAEPFELDGLSAGGHNQEILAGYVSGNFFKILNTKPTIGSLIEPGMSALEKPVLVLGYSFWQSRFDGDPNIIGKSVLINGQVVTIIGVAPRGFHGITSMIDTQAYLPMGMARLTSDAKSDFLTDRKAEFLIVVGRLRSGFRLRSAQAILNVIATRLSAQRTAANKLVSLRAYKLGPVGPATDPSSASSLGLVSAIFLILGGLVLIIACLNVANVILVRAIARQHEIGVRAAMGATRKRLVKQLLTETMALAVLGCMAGLAIGFLLTRFMASINLRTTIPISLELRFDWRVFIYAFALTLVTGIVAGIFPALRATENRLTSLLRESERAVTSGHRRARGALVVLQIAGSLMLLIIAGLFVRSLQNVRHSKLGFDPNDILNFSLTPKQSGYDEAQTRGFLQDLLLHVRSLPGIGSASLAASVPMGYYRFGMQAAFPGNPPSTRQRPISIGYNVVSTGYFETMRIPILQGRGILASDANSSARVAVINQAMAEEYWHAENPIGKYFTNESERGNSIEVVGVAANSRTGGLVGPYIPYAYLPLARQYQGQITLQVRTRLPAVIINQEVLGQIHTLAPTMPVFDIETMNAGLETLNGLTLFKVAAWLAASLGILGLVLGVVGVYGVMSYAASQRTREMGIRIALGAQPTDILKLILREGLCIVGLGMVLGMLGAVAMARLLSSFLVRVSPLDIFTYLIASLLIGIVAIAGCYAPTRRMTRLDPILALHHE